jgi:hypothetical protein
MQIAGGQLWYFTHGSADSPDEFNRILGTFLHQVEAEATESAV